jgi:hypothetical protein
LEANGGQDKAAILSIHALPFLFSFPTALTARSDVAFFCGLQSKSGYFSMTSDGNSMATSAQLDLGRAVF